METKHLAALIILLVLTCGSVLLVTLSHRLRDLALFAFVCGVVMTERMDVNFFGQYWYRGSARGIEVSLLDVLALSLAVAALVAPRYERRRWLWPAGFAFLGLYFLYCCFSVSIAQPKIYGLWELSKILRSILVLVVGALVVRTRRELAIVVVGLGCAVCFEAALGFKQRYVDGIYRVLGTLDHENSLSMYLCTVTPVLMAAAMANWSLWLRIFAGLCCVAGLLAELLTISRAGIPTFALVVAGVAVAGITWKITRRKVVVGSLVAVAVGLLLFKMWDQLAARYGSASLADEYLNEDTEGRGVYFRWAAAILEDHPLGVGLNNWSYYVSKTYGPELGFWYEDYDDIKASPDKADLPSIRYAAPAHSLTALTLGELGIPGICILLLVWLRWFQLGGSFVLRGRLDSDPMHRMGIGFFFAACGIFLHSITEWTYRQTAILFTFHLLMGALASLHFAKKEAARARELALQDERPVEIEAEVVEVAG
jgi:hypothetical protein